MPKADCWKMMKKGKVMGVSFHAACLKILWLFEEILNQKGVVINKWCIKRENNKEPEGHLISVLFDSEMTRFIHYVVERRKNSSDSLF